MAQQDRVESTGSFADKPVLHGELVMLRVLGAADHSAITALLSEPEVARLTGTHRLPDPQSAYAWVASRASQQDRLDMAVVELATGACVGEAVLNQWDPGNRSCNFRIAIATAAQGRGLGTEATRLLVGYGFEVLALHRISLEVYAFNPRAMHVYAKAGFVAEGVLRESLHWDGRWVDATIMSVLAHEWAAHHGRPALART
jgi:RimJ/RimL family protein N-acetyltransferase